MSVFQCSFMPQSIMRPAYFNLVLPNDVPPFMVMGNPHFARPMKTLYLLHGYSGCYNDWLHGSLVANLAAKYNLAVVMPDGCNSFYLNGDATGFAFEDLLARDLPGYVQRTFGLSAKPEDNFIGGLSMGGFGALHTALAHPEVYGKAIGLSSALIVNQLKNMKPTDENPMANYAYYERTFGDLSKAALTRANPEVLVTERLAKGEKIQPLFMACGTEDFLIKENRELHDFLVSKGVEVSYHEAPGVHDWDFWNKFIEPAIQWALDC